MNQEELINLKPGSHIHLMGICGTAMGSLAGLLKAKGFHITGSDQNVYPPMSTQLEKLGISIQSGYKASHLIPRPDCVIVGNVISKHFEEAQALLEEKIPYTSLPKAMGKWVIEDRHSIVIAGTHGKTTSTSMMAVVAEECGQRPGFLIGGVPQNFPYSFKAPEGDWFIIEGDEYDTAFFDKVPKFIHYKPKFVILTSVEFDHADIYDDFESVKQAFARLVELIPEEGLLVINEDDPVVVELAKKAKSRVVSFGLKSGDYRAIDREIAVGRNQFCIEHKGQRTVDVAIKMFGDHNTLNTLGVYALARELGWPMPQVLQGLANYKGIKRRQEVLGEPGGILVIEDFAHHPTAVRLTLESMRKRFPQRRVIAAFEPRSATSRRDIFQKQYATSFECADYVFISEPYNKEKIPVEERLSSQKLVEDINRQSQKSDKAQVFSGNNEFMTQIKKQAQSGDVLVLMSNGGFNGIYQEVLEAF